MSRVPSIRSFIRFRRRRSVLLPHPLGPMNAATDRSGTVSEMSNSACLGPYQKFTPRTASFSVAGGRAGVVVRARCGRVGQNAESESMRSRSSSVSVARRHR